MQTAADTNQAALSRGRAASFRAANLAIGDDHDMRATPNKQQAHGDNDASLQNASVKGSKPTPAKTRAERVVDAVDGLANTKLVQQADKCVAMIEKLANIRSQMSMSPHPKHWDSHLDTLLNGVVCQAYTIGVQLENANSASRCCDDEGSTVADC